MPADDERRKRLEGSIAQLTRYESTLAHLAAGEMARDGEVSAITEGRQARAAAIRAEREAELRAEVARATPSADRLLDVRGQHFNPSAPGQRDRRRMPLSKEVKQEVWARDGRRCQRCRITDSDAVARDGEHLHYDHMLAFSRGGGDTARNIQLLCGRCNRAKGAH